MDRNYYSAIYFAKTTEIVKKHLNESVVLLQFFQRTDNTILCGINESLEFLKTNSDISKYKIRYLEEATLINSGDIVLELEGNYQYFGFAEGVIDGILARQSSLASNAHEIKMAARDKEVVFMGDRADHYINQENDGYAISVGGILTHVTPAQIAKNNGIAIGTMPHVLIQMFDGDLIKALRSYKETFPNENLTALVDFNNDVINDSLKALREFKHELKAVRVDTSANIFDKYFDDKEKEYGVSPNLIKALRNVLDQNEGKHVKIIVSSGFDAKKIKEFEDLNTPVDVYGVGQSLLRITRGFTADAVKINGKSCAKFGRGFKKQDGLKLYK